MLSDVMHVVSDGRNRSRSGNCWALVFVDNTVYELVQDRNVRDAGVSDQTFNAYNIVVEMKK